MILYKTDIVAFTAAGQRYYVEVDFNIESIARLFNGNRPAGSYHPELFVKWLVEKNYLSVAIDPTIYIYAGVTADFEPFFEQ